MLLVLAACVLMIVAFLNVHQEVHIRRLNNYISLDTDRTNMIEDEILSTKLKIQSMNNELLPLEKQRDQLTKQKKDLESAQSKPDTNLDICKNKKTLSEENKTKAIESLQQLKKNLQAEEQKIKEEIQNLQTKLLDRDIKLCSYVDPKLEEGRKMCEKMKNAPAS